MKVEMGETRLVGDSVSVCVEVVTVLHSLATALTQFSCEI
jgi:hypothetical protein